ncbi:MAG: chromosome segregation protein SMC [Pyrinomonadaceae bacterium]
MFKLQRLEITGFKSFADYTEIVFTGNGITAVVGPNGCGKSNVSDAISWVLGEQRAKSLRGGEMKDVVFQGTRDRKPSGMAEVVLHLVRDEEAFDIDDNELEDIDETLSELDEQAVDMAEIEGLPAEGDEGVVETVPSEPVEIAAESNGNGDRPEVGEVEIVQAAAAGVAVGTVKTAPARAKTKRHWRPRTFALDFAPGEAVSVTRRLYLSGESEYLLNGKTCRLRDIQDLFAGTGLSGSHYAIIEQGRIGQILSAKPADRRNLIEEAAGISKFRTRQRAAEARLESSKSNLSRISDIVSEIEKQVNSLRRQAAKTRRFKILQEEYRELMRHYFAAEGRHLAETIAALDADLAAAAERERSLVAEVEAKESAFREATQKARESEETLAEIRKRHSDAALERDRAEREHRYQTEQLQQISTRLEALRAETSAAEERLRNLAFEIERLQEDDARERELAGESGLVLREAEMAYQAKLDVLAVIEAEAESTRRELLQHTAAAERFAEIERQLTANLAKLDERLEGLRREAERAEAAHQTHRGEAEELRIQLEAERQKLSDYQAEKALLVEQSNEARARLQQAEAELSTVRDEYSRKRNRLETLQELEQKRAVYAPQVQKLFAAQDEIGVRLAGVLADRLSVERTAERAVENLFGPYLQTILVESGEDVGKITAWLRENEIGRTAILVLPEGEAAVEHTPSGIESVLGVEPRLAAVLRRAFPREMSAELVDSFDSLEAGPGKTFVNREGDLLFGGGLIVTGKTSANGKADDSLLAFKRELHELESACDSLSADVDAAAKRVEQARAELAEKEEKIVDLQSLIIKVERGLHGLEIQQTAARQEIERAERHRKVVADETRQTETEIAEVRGRIAEAQANVESAESLKTTASQQLEQIAQRLGAARTEAETEAAILNDKRMTAATSAERSRSAQSALRRVENEQKELHNRLGVLQLEIAEGEGRASTLSASLKEIAERIAATETEIGDEQKELAAGIELVSSMRAAADRMNDELVELNHAAAEARNARAELEVRQTEAATRLENIKERCAQELHLTLLDLVEREQVPETFVLDEARRQSDELRERLENFGAVNMLAVEELAEAEERLEFLTSQRQDIIDSIATAEEALREIKERSRERFKQAFEAINENFKEFFQELFGGGRGEMSLLEADDILEAGIEIVAQPPGKRLQNILLLSGGEKAMTAIGLVLAIFKYRPSPFCLLDEVDAPLDDANVGRFVTKIATMAERTQFIVITHNKRTMEAARALYGVTMQEPGVSKIVSVKFE